MTSPAAPHLGRLELDPGLIVSGFDAGFAALVGDGADQVLGRPLDALFSPRDLRGAHRFHEFASHSAGDRLDLTAELRLGRREVLSRLLLDRSPGGFTAFIEDLGRAGNLVSELFNGAELWQEISGQCQDGLALLDERGRLLDFNPSFYRFLDLRSPRNHIPLGEDALRGAVLGHLLPDSLEAVRAPLLVSGARFIHELRHRDRWLEFSARPIVVPRRRFHGTWLHLRDFTEWRHVQLRRDAELRQERLYGLGELVASLARELGGPLGVAAAAADDLHGQLAELQATFEAGILRQSDMRNGLRRTIDAAERARTQLRRGVDLVAGVHRLVVDREKNVRKDMSVGTLIRAVAGEHAPAFAAAGHRLLVDVRVDPVVPTSTDALTQICGQLLSNALAHAFSGGRPGTVVLWVAGADDHIELGCRDDGVGMSTVVLQRAHEPLFTTARERGHAGLGLYLVHNLARDLLQGFVITRAAPNCGTTVILRFPARPAAHPGGA